ncbi:MAG: SIS domain-containing protein [Bacteriovoracia bacterium]
MSTEVRNYLQLTSEETQAAHRKFLEECGEKLIDAARLIGQTVKNKGKILILGNGGSAADAQHMAAEMVGRMLIERRPLPAVALTTDSSNLTAVGNDYGFDQVFDRQVQALARPEDTLLAISTSGNSKNVLAAVRSARKVGCKVIALTGGAGGDLKSACDIWLNVSLGKNSSRVQETHIFAVHSLVDLCDRFFLE